MVGFPSLAFEANSSVKHQILNRLLTVSQAASLLGVSAKTLRNWDQRGKLCPKRHPINGYRLYERTTLEKLASELCEPKPEPRAQEELLHE